MVKKAKKVATRTTNKPSRNFLWPYAGQISALDIKQDEFVESWDVEVKQSANKFSKYRPFATNVKNPVAAKSLAEEAVKRTGLKVRVRKVIRRLTNIKKVEVMKSEIVAYHHKQY